jgi:filamentous hemagglutinin family protein
MPPAIPFASRPLPAALALALYAAGAAANPQGGVVKAGSATISSNGNRLDVVQSSQRAVIDWRSFSIGAGGHVNFKQPSAAGATLNRVTGPELSAILGRLTANGTVFLVNPNGILIGPGAKIDVGGLVAATANISNENFMAGRYKFDEVVNRNAVIVNRGEITAQAGGLVALVAPGVENSGVIRAELGRVALASGNRFTLDLFGDRLVAFAVDDKVAARLTDVDGRPLKAYVNQTGTIEADGGSILIAASAAKAVLDNVINTSGVVRATSFVQRGGEIVLHGGDEGVVRVAGTLDASGRASGASGGSVKVLGAEVVLDAGGRIDVAGDAGGGTALVGGGVQGGGAVPRSSRTTIESGASVNADALTRGNGGTIVAWSDGETRFAGALSARGGVDGGDGGFVEVSGRRELAFNGAVDVGAPAGKGGRLLLDPEFLAVDATTAGFIAAALRTGAAEVRLTASAIDVQQPIDGRGRASGGGLTLDADSSIALNNDIITNDGPVTLRAGAGGISMNAGPASSVTGGQGTLIYAGNAPITLASTGSVIAEHLVTTGAVSVVSGGAVVLQRDLGATLGAGIGSLQVVAAGDARLKGVKTSGGVTVGTNAGMITLDGPLDAGANVIIGDPGRIATTEIKLRHDIQTHNADIEFNGRTLIDPAVQPGETNVVYSRLFRLSTAARFFEAAAVQVSLQTDGGGNVRLNGDALWGGNLDSLPKVRYIYNKPQPFSPFDRTNPAHVAAFRARQDALATGYFGLNISVAGGYVYFGGNLGMPRDAKGNVVLNPAPKSLSQPNLGTALVVGVQTETYTRAAGSVDIRFAENRSVRVGRFRVENPQGTELDKTDVQNSSLFALPRPDFRLLDNRGNLPVVSVTDPGPNVVGPSPRNASVPERLATVGPLREIPLSAQPDNAGAVRAALTADPSGGTGLRLDRSSADVLAPGAPLVPFTAGLARGADSEYFSLGPFEFVQTRASAGR